MIRVGVCDDDQRFLSQTEDYLSRIQKKYHYEMQTEVYSSGKELLDDFIQGIGFDMVFLDIEMEEMDGIETAKQIRQTDYHLPLIYISSYDSYMKQLFEVEPFRFLQKPLQFEELEAVFLKAVKRVEEQKNSYYRFQVGKSRLQVLCREILYFESDGRKVIVHTASKQYKYYDKLDHVEELMAGYRFIRIHKAYLVNLDNIEAFQYERVALTDGTILNISEKNRSRIRNEFWDYYEGESNG